tara:strand:+ start:1338 stop:1925 length:588 start_codon:yes stop_codon:yes gene_type:complete
MNNIKIYNNFFDKNDIDKIFEIITNSSYTCNCLERSYQNRYGATSYFQNAKLMEYSFITEYCKKILYKVVKTNFRILRCNLLCNSNGQTGSFHVDHEAEYGLTEYKNHQNTNTTQFTIMIYVNYNEHYKEPTKNVLNNILPTSSIIFKTDKKHLIEIETIHNRLVMFPAYYVHKPHEYTGKDIRTAITFKCEYID